METISSSSLSRNRSPFSDDGTDESVASSCLIARDFCHLPAELRLKIWSCAVEPRIIILDDLLHKTKSYPLPSVTQLSHESRTESRCGYEDVGRGSHAHFDRDIIVCDPTISEKTADAELEAVAGRIQRAVFWDRFPDDKRIVAPYSYASYLTACYAPVHDSCPVVCDKLLFPNLKELWIVKVGHVDKSWLLDGENGVPFDTRLRQTARVFRYWVDHGVVEMAPLCIDDPDTKLVLRQGRCSKDTCRELNRGRALMVSKVVFLDGDYQKVDSLAWKPVIPWPACTDGKPERTHKENWRNEMRWAVVERALTFSLRWDWPTDSPQAARRRRRSTLPAAD